MEVILKLIDLSRQDRDGEMKGISMKPFCQTGLSINRIIYIVFIKISFYVFISDWFNMSGVIKYFIFQFKKKF